MEIWNGQGIIFDISHYMIEDGPGIRTNVFVKGCPLRCKWCSNAFGLKKQIEMAFYEKKCVGCGVCTSRCPHQAIWIDTSMKKAVTDRLKCNNCLECVAACKMKARVRIGTEITSSEIINEVKKDQVFYRRGGGGVTISGGEILLQPEFVIELLEKCDDTYLDTVIETSGYGKWDDLESMILKSNLVFIDCKLMDDEKHKQVTGVSNFRIIQNIQKAAVLCVEKKKRLVIRLPLIPGVTDSDENICSTAEFVKSLPGKVELNVLPYHNYGADKYEKLGVEYAMNSIECYKKEELEKIESKLCKTGVRFSIGGYKISDEIDYTTV